MLLCSVALLAGEGKAQVRVPIGEPIVSGSGPAPTGLKATPVSPTSITVTWDALSGVSGYLVERRKSTDASCCNAISGRLVVPTWSDNTLIAATQYTYRVNVTYTDGRTGYAEVSATTLATPVPGPVPAKYGGTPIDKYADVTWTPVPNALEYSLLKNGVEVSRGGACTPTCIMRDLAGYGTAPSYAIQTRFTTASNMLPSQTPNFVVAVPHIITVQQAAYLVARDAQIKVTITNTANPDGSRGGLVTGSGNGIRITDPGSNALALITAPTAPLGRQRIQLNAVNTAPAFVDAVVMRTPGPAGVALGNVVSQTAGAYRLVVDQLSANRYGATFNALPRIEFERENGFGGATLCPTSNAVGVVITANGRRAGVASPWAIVLQELNRSPAPPAHVIEAQRFSPDGKVGLVPVVYTTPDCTVAVVLDVAANAPTPYRVRAYDLLTRQILHTATFSAVDVTYRTVSAALLATDLTKMTLTLGYPGSNFVNIALPHPSF
jgi:hypothetical protein